MYKLNLMATFRLLHLKFTGSRMIVISFSFIKINGLIVNYLKTKIQQLAQKMPNSRIIVKLYGERTHLLKFLVALCIMRGGVSERHDVYTNIVLDRR